MHFAGVSKTRHVFCETVSVPQNTLKNTACDKYFLVRLSFSVDILESVNSVNLSLQGKDRVVVHCRRNLTIFETSLTLWCSGWTAKFPHLNAFLGANGLRMNDGYVQVYETPRFCSW